MKTLEEIKDLMVGKSVITNLVDLLRTNDEEFAESEKKYLAALETLRTELPSEFTPTPDEYLEACESDVISGVAYAGYLGFRVNLENFHHPIGIDFVRLDTIDYLKDHLFGHFQVNYRNAQKFVKHFTKDSLRPLCSSRMISRTTSRTWNALDPSWPTMPAT